jgi:REP element-mobilizing transposase RayT
MARYRHWQNYGEPGDVIFVTTRVLDFAHIFDTPELRDHMVRLLFSTHRRWSATLHAYAVMVNHIHFVTRLPENMGASKFVQQVKGNSGSFFVPRLTEEHRKALSLQVGLNRRSLWQVGFHSTVLTGDMFWQKVEYSHLNPIRAELVADSTDYRWSSAHLFAGEHLDDATGLMHVPMNIVLP